jgi:putative methyltransferase (TIGR04325 family)
MGQELIKEIAAFKLKQAKTSPHQTFAEPIVQDILRLLSQIPLKRASLLDFGCGNGIYYYILSSHPSTADWEYTGADANPEFVRFCKANLPHLRYEELHADELLPFQDEEFDIILASGVIQCIRDYQAVLGELHRISKKYVVLARLPMWDSDSILLLQHFKHRKDITEQHLALRVFNREKLESQLKKAGFKILNMERGSETLITPDTGSPVSYFGYVLEKESVR